MNRLIKNIIMVGVMMVFIKIGMGTADYYPIDNNNTIVPACYIVNDHPDFYYNNFVE